MIHSSYMDAFLKRPRLTVDRICKIISKEFPKCGGIVSASGLSGSLLVLPVALKLKKPFAIVRNKKSNSSLPVEGDDRVRRYVIIDDLIESGRTFGKVIREMRKWNRSQPAGAVLYWTQGSRFDYWMDRIDTKDTIERGTIPGRALREAGVEVLSVAKMQ